MKLLIISQLFGLLCLVNFSTSELINARDCKKATDSNYSSTIHNVTVSPCPGAPDGPCDIPRGTNATIVIQFTPNVKITKRARHGYYWEQSATLDLPFAGVNPKACKYMKCPGKKNKLLSYEAVLPIRKNLPAGTYDTKIKIYDGTKVFACKVFRVRLV